MCEAVRPVAAGLGVLDVLASACWAPLLFGMPVPLTVGMFGTGTKEEEVAGRRTLKRSKVPPRAGSCAVGSRQAPNDAGDGHADAAAALDPQPPCAAGSR
jgi:hypothetical protein